MAIKPDKKIKFWTILVEGNSRSAQERFSTKQDAILEAERIAAETFYICYVMEAVSVAGPLTPTTGSEAIP